MTPKWSGLHRRFPLRSSPRLWWVAIAVLLFAPHRTNRDGSPVGASRTGTNQPRHSRWHCYRSVRRCYRWCSGGIVSHLANGLRRLATTNGAGIYRFEAVDLGTHTPKVVHSRFYSFIATAL